MRIVNEGALYSDRSKLSVAFYLRARSIRGRGVFEEIRYLIIHHFGHTHFIFQWFVVEYVSLANFSCNKAKSSSFIQ